MNQCKNRSRNETKVRFAPLLFKVGKAILILVEIVQYLWRRGILIYFVFLEHQTLFSTPNIFQPAVEMA